MPLSKLASKKGVRRRLTKADKVCELELELELELV
jgi:hypothetical protein